MFQKIKRILYFAAAWYFRLFADIKLKRWNPRIIVITGSSGKTTLLHLLESQLGNMARYSHHANSSIGIPFDILGVHREKLTLDEWPGVFLSAPFKTFSPIPQEKIYVVEADCDRPYEGNFLSSFLRPDITLWTNVSRTHAMNFEGLVKKDGFGTPDKAITHEFGFFSERTKSLVIANGDSDLIRNELKRTRCQIETVSAKNSLTDYAVTTFGSTFVFKKQKFVFPFLLPKEAATSILMCKKLLDYLKVDDRGNFSGLNLPPGRNSYFKGIKDTTIVDSTYNANLDSMTAIINMFSQIRSANKWVVLGDMLELGSLEKEEHERLADLVAKHDFKRIVLMGPRVSKYTYPRLKTLLGSKAILASFINPKEVLDYLEENIKGGEVLLFKGARFLEGVIEHLLANKEDVQKLSRREKVWEIRRKKWGL